LFPLLGPDAAAFNGAAAGEATKGATGTGADAGLTAGAFFTNFGFDEPKRYF